LELNVREVNADDRKQVLKKGTGLGKLAIAEVIKLKECCQGTTKPKKGVDVIQQMMDSLPNKLTKK